MKVAKGVLILTADERKTLVQASAILEAIADKMDRAVQVPWTIWSDDEIYGACEIINDITRE